MKNWKTTAAALLGLAAIGCTQAAAILDGNPATVADWTLILAAVPACLGLIFASDAGKKA